MRVSDKYIENYNQICLFFDKFSLTIILLYVVTLLTCNIFFPSPLPLYIIIIGIFSVILFFNGCKKYGKKWIGYSETRFIKVLFLYSFGIRLIYSCIIIFLNYYHYDTYYESNVGDIFFYVPESIVAASRYGFDLYGAINSWLRQGADLSDVGYVTYLTLIFNFMGVDGSINLYPDNPFMLGYEYIWLPIFFKAMIGSYTCVLMYKVSKTHFGDIVGKYTAIFCMFQFNMIWWCGSMMKETEMIFLSVLFIYRMDNILCGLKTNILYMFNTLLVGFSLYFFRTALFFVLMLSVVIGVFFIKSKFLTSSKKIVICIFFMVFIAYFHGSFIRDGIKSTIELVQDSEYQKKNMEWRSSKKDGNVFAKYASATIFAPLIFTIPFPTMVYTYEDQEMIAQVNGGNFEKNILSFFVIFIMIYFIKAKEWRKHIFLISYLVGYLSALVLSVFAQSGRFHMPIIPFEMMFAAYGLSLMNKKRLKWFNYALVLEFVFCVAWAWFKLKGRNMM